MICSISAGSTIFSRGLPAALPLATSAASIFCQSEKETGRTPGVMVRQERELNQGRTSSASPLHGQGPDVAAKLPYSNTVSELSLAREK